MIEWLCEVCDWLGSPTDEPECCPQCGGRLSVLSFDDDEEPE